VSALWRVTLTVFTQVQFAAGGTGQDRTAGDLGRRGSPAATPARAWAWALCSAAMEAAQPLAAGIVSVA
jgi:hypothetical protein